MHKVESDFLSNKIKLNPKLVNKIQMRMPKYTFARFANPCDVTNTFRIMINEAEPLLNFHVSDATLDDLDNLDNLRDVDFAYLLLTVRHRFHQFVAMPLHSDLRWCTPWLSKERPASVKSSTNSLLGKIYVGIVTTHSSDADFVAVQEAERRFGYMPPVFGAKATVAFPPICHGEVWTVGWVQALSKSSQMIACENDFVLVLVCIISVFALILTLK